MICAQACQGRCSLGLLVRLGQIPAVALELADIDVVFEVNASRCRQRFFNSRFAPHSRFSIYVVPEYPGAPSSIPHMTRGAH